MVGQHDSRRQPESDLPALQWSLGLTGLDLPTELAALSAEALSDPLGWLRVHAPGLLVQQILALHAMAGHSDVRVRGSALKAAADVTLRALALFQPKGLTTETLIRSQEDLPKLDDYPPEVQERITELIDLLKASGYDVLGYGGAASEP